MALLVPCVSKKGKNSFKEFLQSLHAMAVAQVVELHISGAVDLPWQQHACALVIPHNHIHLLLLDKLAEYSNTA